MGEEQREKLEESDYDSCHIGLALSQASDGELAKCQPMEMCERNKAMLFLSTLNPVTDVLSLYVTAISEACVRLKETCCILRGFQKKREVQNA